MPVPSSFRSRLVAACAGLVLCVLGPVAHALVISIENISPNGAPQTGIDLGFDLPPVDPLNDVLDFVTHIDFAVPLLVGETFVTADIPEISVVGTTLDYANVRPSNITAFYPGIPIGPGAIVEVGSSVGNDRVRLTFIGVAVPEPAALGLLALGLAGLGACRRRRAAGVARTA